MAAYRGRSAAAFRAAAESGIVVLGRRQAGRARGGGPTTAASIAWAYHRGVVSRGLDRSITMTPRHQLLVAARDRARQIADFTEQALNDLLVGDHAAATRWIDSALCRLPYLQCDLTAAQIATVRDAE